MSDLARHISSALLLAVSALTLACPAGIEDPGRFSIAPGECDQTEQLVIAQRCGNVACHESSKPASGLDLVSPGLAGRLLEARSEQCGDRPLVVPAAPAESFLVEKLGTGVRCGGRMPPFRQPLNDDEVACVIQWISRLGEAPAPDAGAADSTPADGGADAARGSDAADDSAAGGDAE